MTGMIRGGKILFIADENWRENNLSDKIKLPLFVHLAGVE